MAKTIDGVLIKYDPEGAEAPAVFDSPHSGMGIPPDFGTVLSREQLHAGGVDTHVHDLFRDCPRFGAHYLEALYLRSYVDPNRNEDDIDAKLLSEPWPGKTKVSEQAKRGKGLIWDSIPPGLALYARKLSAAEVRNRIETYWRPYQNELKAAMDALHARHGVVYHFNCHSNRTLAPRNSPEGEGTRRPEMELGTLDGTTCEPGFTELCRDTLKACGYQVVVDGFHKGEHLIRHYSNPKAGRHSIMLEIRKDLYMDEKTQGRGPRFAECQANMAKLARAICDYARAKARR